MSADNPPVPERIGRFQIVHKLGEGGMGIVYAARDSRLERDVAVKVMREAGADRAATERLFREARAAAALTHPAFCQIFEIDEDEGRPFLVMELLGGQSLASRLSRGVIPTSEAVSLGLELLAALDVLHERGLVHRDLKPSNLFLTPHGLKVLDFGLTRPTTLSDETMSGATLPGTIVGSPHYMAPEQARGEPADARTDLFAVGVLLFEMLAGQRPFEGNSVIAVLHSVLADQPPALTGSPAILGADRVIHRALSKEPAHRYGSATEMANDLRGVAELVDSGEIVRAQAVTRLAVLPFRQLRPDAEVDYLSYGLSDAVTSSLAGFESFVVRSSLATARYGNDPEIDVRKVAAELDVDLLLAGTLLRSGNRLRVGIELVEAATGKAAWSRVEHVTLGDIFELQDGLARRIVESLPLTAADRARRRSQDVPANQQAYSLFLRANRYAHESSTWRLAHQLYEQCLELDPDFAPAWARLGRMERVLGKYSASERQDEGVRSAEESLRRALEISPDLSEAHLYYAQLDTDLGRVEQALERLLRRAVRDQAEPEIYAGLVHACRYCGLLSASRAAYELAKHLDPSIETSALYTLWALGEYDRALAESLHASDTIDCLILESMGQHDEALVAARREEERYSAHLYGHQFYTAMRAYLEGDRDGCRAAVDVLKKVRVTDGEALYLVTRIVARLGDTERGVAMMDRVVSQGYFCTPMFKVDPWLASLAGHPQFERTLADAEARHAAALAIFEREGGPAVLGLRSPV